MTFRYTTSVCPGSHWIASSNNLVSSVASLNASISPFLYSNLTSKFPAWILLTPVDAVSVNHAKVAPMSIATHMSRASALVSNARLVDLLFSIMFFLPIV